MALSGFGALERARRIYGDISLLHEHDTAEIVLYAVRKKIIS